MGESFNNYDEMNKVVFNSNNAVLDRLNKIIYGVNICRQNSDHKGMLNFIIDFFKELVGDLSEDERVILWDKIQIIQRTSNPLLDTNVMRVWKLLDEVDIDLRITAKKYGFLTTNKQEDSIVK